MVHSDSAVRFVGYVEQEEVCFRP